MSPRSWGIGAEPRGTRFDFIRDASGKVTMVATTSAINHRLRDGLKAAMEQVDMNDPDILAIWVQR